MTKLLVAAVLAVCAAPAAAATHTVIKGDTLWALAGHYYQNNFRWKAIYAANRDKVKDPHWIYPGQVLDIPETPAPEIGELPARPVEKEAAPAPPPQEEAAAPTPAPAPAPAEAAPKPAPAAVTEDLSTKIPEGLTGGYPSVSRLKQPDGWKEDGAVTDFDGEESLAAQGDYIFAKLPGAHEGERFTIYRRAAPEELDADQKAHYLAVIGSAEAKSSLGGSRWRMLVLKSGDSVQTGDLLKREGDRP